MSNGKPAGPQSGFTYLTLLIAVAIIGIGLAAAGTVWSQSQQREKERELLFIGEQFRRAIALYYERSPGGVKRYPQTLQDLLEDKRYLSPHRYLRRIYADPMTGKPDWGFVTAPAGGIMGVHSRSGAKPIKSANFSERHASFEKAQRYAEWRFIYQPEVNPMVQAPPQPPGAR